MRRYCGLWILILIVPCLAQVDKRGAGDSGFDIGPIPPARFDPRWIIDSPTAHMLPRGAFDLDMRTFPEGGVQASLDIGLADRFSVGLCYGGAKILSEMVPEWNPRIEFKFRYRMIEGTGSFPDVSIGFSSFGYGLFQEKDSTIGYLEDRYLVKSPGFYLVFSQKYPAPANSFSVHGGINYSLENTEDSDPDFFIGLIANLGYQMVFLSEYDLAINDNKPAGRFGRGRGYLNMGLAWYITSDLSLEADFRNLLSNRRNLDGAERVIDREVRLVYLQFFKD